VSGVSSVDGRLADGALVRVVMEGGRIRSIGPPAADAVALPAEQGGLDAGWMLVPGLVDLQVNGYGGFDVNADDVSVATISGLARALWAAGTTTFFPTVITAGEGKIVHALEVIAEAVGLDPLLAHSIAGIHVEGPYLSPVDGPRGAHDLAALRDPDARELERWVEASAGLLRIVTLAPERSGSTEYISAAVRAGVLVSVGHCDATAAQIHGAADAGATLSTHLGNGIQPSLPRHPNQLWAQLADDRLAAGFIADGQHLPADTFTAMVRAKGVGRSFLVSDAAALAGSAPGEYATAVGGAVTVTASGRLELAATGLLAGSGSSLAECVRWARESTPLAHDELLAMATSVPARLAGLADRGVLEVGAAADLLLVAPDFTVRRTILAGEIVHP
jgi:N-acetylglucosamine-6-phosphate deacetylase